MSCDLFKKIKDLYRLSCLSFICVMWKEQRDLRDFGVCFVVIVLLPKQ